MEKGKRRQLLRRSAKPACFLLVISLLLVLSRVAVPYAVVQAGATALSESDRNKVIITSLNGNTLTTGGDVEDEVLPSPVTFDTWNQTSNQILLQPQGTSSGCSTTYSIVITIDVATANEMNHAQEGAMNVTVTDNSTEMLLTSRLLAIDFKPGQPDTVETSFVLTSDQADPVYLVMVSFPTSGELQSAPATIIHVPLFEYILMKAGILSSSLLT